MKKTSRRSASKKNKSTTLLPFFASPVSAGFPTPINDENSEAIDLNTFLISNRTATYLVRVQGTSMNGVGIYEDDVLVVDASLTPRSGQIVVANIEGEFLVKRYMKEKGIAYLKAENPTFSPIAVTKEMEGGLMGVVTAVVRKFV